MKYTGRGDKRGDTTSKQVDRRLRSVSESLPGQSAFCMFDIGKNSRSHSEHDGKLKKNAILILE